jgi:NitT/TauT family transport system ATP-binding protein
MVLSTPERSLPDKAEPAPAAIDCRDVSMVYGMREVLTNINLSVTRGDFLTIVGPSGCGKTTLLRAIAGLVKPTSGSVYFDGRVISEPQTELAIVFQDYNRALLPWRTVSRNVALALQARNIPKSEYAARIGKQLEMLGLKAYAEHFPAQLSGGLQQRVQIARALALEPQILLMDEPFGALDAITRQRLQDQLLEIWSATKTTVIFITHDLEEALYLGDRIIVLEANPGRIAADVPVELDRPRNQLTTREDARFIASRHRLFAQLGHA